MKPKLERFALGLILAPLAPLAGFMFCWWAAYTLLPETWIPFVTIAGLLAGLLVDIPLLKKLLDRRLSLPAWMAVFLFYTIGIFGMFMGVPVINAALAIPAGFVVGTRLVHARTEKTRVKTAAWQTSLFTSLILALICTASATLALLSPSTAADLQGMLALPFAVTPAMIWGLILFGGAGLLAVNWLLTTLSVHLTHRFLAS